LGPAGFVTRVGAPSETAEALRQLAQDSQLRQRMGASGRERVSRYYDLAQLRARYHEIYLQQANLGGKS
jgi:glycosyltransferase involved in cell wall biosynthesis